MFEHSDITRTLETGTPYIPHRGALRCVECGCEIRDGDPYWKINDDAYCPECAENTFRRYA